MLNRLVPLMKEIAQAVKFNRQLNETAYNDLTMRLEQAERKHTQLAQELARVKEQNECVIS